jgi:hypothetical protein
MRVSFNGFAVPRQRIRYGHLASSGRALVRCAETAADSLRFLSVAAASLRHIPWGPVVQHTAEIFGVRGVMRDWFSLIVLGAIALTALAVQLPFALNHDAAWHFETSFRLLEGARFGDSVYDVNPPISAWLFTLPAAICNLTGASPTLVFKLFTFAMMLGALGASARLLPLAAPDLDDPVFAQAALAYALLLLPGYDFGQREHLVCALTLPYVLLAAARARGAKISFFSAMIIGFAAAIGVGVKPYFLLLPLCVELWLVAKVRYGVLRVELLTMAGVLLLYVFAVDLFAPDYLWRVVPDAMIAYSAFQVGWIDLARIFALRLGPYMASAATLCVVLRGRLSPVLQACAIAAFAFLTAAVWQRKGWAYQLYPAQMYCIFFVGLALSVRALSTQFVAAGRVTAAVLLLVSGASIVAFVEDGLSRDGTTARVRALTAIFREHRSVFAFITSPRDVHPAVLESRAHWTSASGVLVFLPAMLNTPGNLAAVKVGARRNLETLAELKARPPAVIVVDAASEKLGIEQPNFDYLKFFAGYPGFTVLMRNYAERPRIGTFRIFLRKHPLAARLPGRKESLDQSISD